MKVTKTCHDGVIMFVCPKCGGHKLEEVLINAHIETPITFQVEPSRTTGMRMIYGQTTCIEGDIERYQCSACGFTPSQEDGDPICDDEALEEWLNNPVGIEEQLDKD